MLKHFITLEWKSFVRSASFGSNMVLKIFMILAGLYFIALFLLLGAGSYYILEENNLKPFPTITTFLIYYFFADILIRFFLQKAPVMNIKPLLFINIRKNSIVNYALGKTLLSFFNVTHLFFFIPFSVVLMVEGFAPLGVMSWLISMLLTVFAINYLNILINKNDYLLYGIGALVGLIGVSQYYSFFDLTLYTGRYFSALYETPWLIIVPLALFVGLYSVTFRFFKKNLYLDAGLATKHEIAKTEELTWLNQFGTLGTFLKNDIRLLKRNKRSRTTIGMSILFLFYGLLFFTDSIEAYQAPLWKIFAAIFVTGGFLLNFGQFVPSWDSAYYPLMMSQNIKYRDYLNSKWWLMVMATVISTLLASFYLYFGVDVYLAILVGAIYNMGVNAHIVLWAGAYIKTPIDLSSSKNAFGDRQAFNVKTLLLALPKIVLPLLLYGIGYYTLGANFGFVLVAGAGVIGFAFRNKVFTIIEKTYKSEKYKTLEAYKQKN
ncbi:MULTISPECIES: DUF5687 family protein [unclassified Flavobacterium]|uniref:DUF5687 family protein n=1 Tax=unclassified Flavobacterium TaxID=196869 RepID=UPI00261FFFCC|nr:DUF5687 family protein [Flavobacterium sp.]